MSLEIMRLFGLVQVYSIASLCLSGSFDLIDRFSFSGTSLLYNEDLNAVKSNALFVPFLIF